jgi:NAD(P)-dependent dehydrogenase (short-subunit alcohol dehydrogenase family)
MSESTLLLIGASRGLGLALAQEFLGRGWRVIATERTEGAALHGLAASAGARLEIETLDILDEDAILALRRRLAGRRIDLLFVNSGVANGPGDRVGDLSAAEFQRVLATNTLGPLRVIDACATLVPPEGAIGVMSSGLGSVANNSAGGWEVYRASKAALNTLVRSYAARPDMRGRSFVSIAPGWVRTDMGGAGASLGIDESIPKVADVLAGQLGKPGARFLNYLGETLPW